MAAGALLRCRKTDYWFTERSEMKGGLSFGSARKAPKVVQFARTPSDRYRGNAPLSKDRLPADGKIRSKGRPEFSDQPPRPQR